MFPREMLAIRRRGDEVHPVLAPVDAEHRALARDLVRVFASHVGRPRRELDEALTAHELRLGPRYKLARGLAMLLERRSAFEMATRVDPALARRVAFEHAAALPAAAATTPEARAQALSQAALALHVDVADLERALDADNEDALVLVAADEPEPEALLRRYNLGMVQTLLFDAQRVELVVERGFRELLGLVKLNGLMHRVERTEDERHRIVLDGPVSLFRDTRRYGTAIAKVLPGLARCGRWSLEAEVQDRFDADRVRRFRATHETLPMPKAVEGGGDAGALEGAPPEEYDSAVERRFAQGWTALRSQWRAVREPAALQVDGGELFFPDFGFAWRDGPVRAYLEIVGFWTPGYLERKLAKLRRLPSPAPLLLAVDAGLGVSEADFADTPGDVLLYKDDVPLVPVVQWLKRLEAHIVDEEVGRVLAAPTDAKQPVIRIDDIAREAHVSPAAVEQALPKLDLGPRVRIGDALVAPAALDAIAKRLKPGTPVADVESMARKSGIADTSSLLSHLGWRAAWQGLDTSKAIIARRQ